MRASMTEMNVVNADRVATLDRALKVRGREQISEMIAVTSEKIMVQAPWPLIVLRYSAPTKQCKP